MANLILPGDLGRKPDFKRKLIDAMNRIAQLEEEKMRQNVLLYALAKQYGEKDQNVIGGEHSTASVPMGIEVEYFERGSLELVPDDKLQVVLVRATTRNAGGEGTDG